MSDDIKTSIEQVFQASQEQARQRAEAGDLHGKAVDAQVELYRGVSVTLKNWLETLGAMVEALNPLIKKNGQELVLINTIDRPSSQVNGRHALGFRVENHRGEHVQFTLGYSASVWADHPGITPIESLQIHCAINDRPTTLQGFHFTKLVPRMSDNGTVVFMTDPPSLYRAGPSVTAEDFWTNSMSEAIKLA